MLLISQLGFFALMLATILLLGLLPSIGFAQTKQMMRISCLAIFFAYGCLTLCFLGNEFHLQYVALHSSTFLPWFYRLCAVWGGHEGSILLWLTILAAFAFILSFQIKENQAKVLMVVGVVMLGLLGFILFTSNPFHLQFTQGFKQGLDLNPLLQDPGFLFHPPMLYCGYVGYAIPFAIAMSGLMTGQFELSSLKLMKLWSMFAWSCLTLGITLGSWWAYRELGWGGFWFWDPVENASLMPWLIGTALLHALIMSERQGLFLSWTLLLSIAAFCLSLIGTFLVRSGVITSVHAFATDPSRGMYILGFLALMMFWSFTTYLWRSPQLLTKTKLYWLSRESGILINNLLLLMMTLIILLGTLYPLIIDGLNLGKISVGAPYFNESLSPILVFLLLFMALGIQLKWHKDEIKNLYFPILLQGLMAGIVAGLISGFLYQQLIAKAWLMLTMALWVMFALGFELFKRRRRDGHLPKNFSFWSMFCAHQGFAIAIMGIVIASSYGEERDLRMQRNESITLQGYQIQMREEEILQQQSYEGTQVRMHIQQSKHAKDIFPEKRIYRIGHVVMTDADIDYNLWRDIYVALGTPVGENAWSLRIYYKPCIRWIWLGGIFMFFAGVLALLRYLSAFYQRRE